jgi:hypothetical protein
MTKNFRMKYPVIWVCAVELINRIVMLLVLGYISVCSFSCQGWHESIYGMPQCQQGPWSCVLYPRGETTTTAELVPLYWPFTINLSIQRQIYYNGMGTSRVEHLPSQTREFATFCRVPRGVTWRFFIPSHGKFQLSALEFGHLISRVEDVMSAIGGQEHLDPKFWMSTFRHWIRCL